MAMIPCKECGQRISDRAPRCPACGAPTGLSSVRETSPGARRWWAPLLGIWCLAILSWFVISSRGRAELLAFFGHDRPPTPASLNAAASLKPAAQTARVDAIAVYETTAEQLSQDYSANAVAMENKIGGRRIRVRGVVSAIDEDAAGHALVKLRTAPGTSVDFRLDDGQKTAAAALVKGQAVTVECGNVQHGVVSPLASGCILVPLQATGATSYLALLYSTDRGRSPLYIVGPLSEEACAERGEQIANQLPAAGRRVSKTCAATARESMPSGDCRLTTSMSSLPDMPDAHLWRYDCAGQGPALVRLNDERPASRKTTANPVHKPARSAIVQTPDEAVVDEPQPAATSSGSAIVAPPPTAAPVAAPLVREEPTPDVPVAAAAPAVAAASAPAAATPVPLAQGASASAVAPVIATAAADTAALPPDLSSVGAKDQAAATRINSYCSKVTASAANRDAVALGCRREEIAAWNRFAVQNEFPSLDDATRQKCNNPPFPDSYVAKEACAKYQLRIN